MVSEHPSTAVIDRHTFEKLIEAAYVLQEHNRKMRRMEENLESQSEHLREEDLAQESLRGKSHPESKNAAARNTDYTLTLAEIVEAQHQIQMRHLDLDDAMNVVADRITRIAGASGAGIAILEGNTVRYRAGAGSAALPAGTQVPLTSAICQPNLRTGQVIRTRDVSSEFLFDPEPVRQRGIRSLVAVPIHYDGNVVGALELYFDRIQGYADQDIHTCQLMAGLVTEAMGREAGLTLKKSMAEERSSMLAAIAKLQPNLAVLAKEAGSTNEGRSPNKSAPEESARQISHDGATAACWKCGNNLLAEDQFCGKCGASRTSAAAEGTMQSKLAWAWNSQQAKLMSTAALPIENQQPQKSSEEDRTTEERNQSQVTVKPHEESGSLMPFTPGEADALVDSLLSDPAPENENLMPVAEPSDASDEGTVWSSAARAQDYLESLSATRTPGALVRFWRSRRGDFYLALAVVLVVFVIGWAAWSSHSSNSGSAISQHATKARRSSPEADLTLFDKFLVAVGLAEPPEVPQDSNQGNPDIQVWVDLNTAQYYCPGSDLYQKTAKGKFLSQREAELDQFEPAYRKACE